MKKPPVLPPGAGAVIRGAVLAASLVVTSPFPLAQASPAFAVSNPDWEILVTEHGYSDLMLDRRPGFEGREYLSGEWAAAVCFVKGGVTNAPIWLEPEWIFPDWFPTNADFKVEVPFGFASPPTNSDGFFVFSSTITNESLRIAMTYEMLDSVTGILMGVAPRSAGPPGTSVLSSRYVFRQTYRIENISGVTLTGLKLFQFLHGLETDTSVYDDRNYGGTFGEYRYDSTQWGTSYSLHKSNATIVLNHDWLSFMSRSNPPPDAWDASYYGILGTDSHAVGKPGVGLHINIEQNSLQTNDYFHPPEGRWVSGAQRYDLASLAPGGTVTKEVLLTLRTTSEVAFAGINVEILNLGFTNTSTFKIVFTETIGGPVGFSLWKSSELVPFDPSCSANCAWERVFIPYFYNPMDPSIKWFQPVVDRSAPKCFFLIEPTVIVTPPPD